ncbi:uncharacterized protein LOC122081314 isoform X3 [Macadamia integrifolia]|uniref:uncharacterized protein LOC122081314 isoform X3 n=1 Tax=Macadamia integrifolia TaxID=60698 RepID=UPI001C4FD82B|nr:uncharacterized protein LOC122081314 isoform X3 [Macadamia integrifolia]
MGSIEKNYLRPANGTQDALSSSFTPSFETLLDAMKNPQVPKLVLLRKLYYLLIHLSMNSSLYSPKFGASNDSNREGHQSTFNLPFTDICNLSNFLFEELSRKFEHLFSGSESASQQLDILVHPEDLKLLLRCCMGMLRLLEFNQGFLLEKCKILLAILCKLCSSDVLLHISRNLGENAKHALRFERSFSRQCVYAGHSGFTTYVEEYNASMCIVEEAGSPIPFLCSLLEVFADELLLHRHLRLYFMIADSVSSATERLFMCHNSHGDSDDVLEVISAHFILSLSDEQASSKLQNASLWWHSMDLRTSELTLTASLALLGSPVISSAPKIIQAHLLFMVSRAIGIDIAPQNTRSDFRFMNGYISALERSIMLYTHNISSLRVGDDLLGVYTGSFSSVQPGIWKRGFHPSFECYIRPVTYSTINHKITELACSQHSHVCDLNSRKKSDLLNASILYMKDNQSVLDKSSREEILSILNCIISRTLSLESEGIIGCFQQCSVSQPVQKLFPEAMRSCQSRHKESKLMFMHFAGLLLFSFARELEFLWKGCIFMMMTMMNLFIFEEGNLDALRELLGLRNNSLSSISSIDKVSQVQIGRDSSLTVASEFQKIQMLCLSRDTLSRYEEGKQDSSSETSVATLPQGARESVEGIVEKTCNGEIFMKSTPEFCWKASDIDDLADFIECKQGKDYSKWLKGREKYRKWKHGKTEVVRKERKKSFRFLLGE